MRWFGILGLVVALGCGSSGDGGPAAGADAATDTVDAGASVDANNCDPFVDNACGPDQDCAFVLDFPSTGDGHSGCVTAGSGRRGDSCTEPTAAGQGDDCGFDTHCHEGTCRSFCSLQLPLCYPSGDCTPVVGWDLGVCIPSD
jgi:hypothetical protein